MWHCRRIEVYINWYERGEANIPKPVYVLDGLNEITHTIKFIISHVRRPLLVYYTALGAHVLNAPIVIVGMIVWS